MLITKTICNKGFTGYSSIILSRIKIRIGGQDSRPQSSTAHSLSKRKTPPHPAKNPSKTYLESLNLPPMHPG